MWFNHLTFFHVTTLPADLREGLREMFAEEDLPTNTYYGDGEPIPDDVIDAPARLLPRRPSAGSTGSATTCCWWTTCSPRTAASRSPGQRKIAVAMAEPSNQLPLQ